MGGRRTSALVATLGVTIAIGACGGPQEHSATPESNPTATTSGRHTAVALDAYPGFGLTQHAVLRDDAIAAWESFRREILVRPCMAKHGFSYWPPLLYPNLGEVANFLRISIPKEAPTAGVVKNERYIAELIETDRTRYFLALDGEAPHPDGHSSLSPADVGESEREFPAGGCRRKSDKAIPGIWTTRRALDDELFEMFHALNRIHPIGRRNMERYAADRKEMEQRIADRHRDELEVVRKRYLDAEDQIRTDKDFVECLRQHVVYSREND